VGSAISGIYIVNAQKNLISNLTRPHLTFVFRAGRRERLSELGEVPTEFLYGYPQLLAAGWIARFIEDADIGMAPPLSPLAALVNKAARFFGLLPIGMVVPLFERRFRDRLPRHSVIVATTNGIGLALGLARMLGLVNQPVMLLAMGLVSLDAGRWKRLVFKIVTRNLTLVTISKGEQAFLKSIFPLQCINYIPFGVDHRFWYPAPLDIEDEGFAFAIGNDANRDWGTLVKAWHPGLPSLKIITSMPVPKASANVEVIHGNWLSKVMTDKRIRELFWRSSFVIVPLKETIQPSGQSVCLQAMACGKAVVMTDNSGIWDRDLMIDDYNVLMVKPGDRFALNKTVLRLFGSKILRQNLGANARKTIEQHLNTDIMAESLANLLKNDENLHIRTVDHHKKCSAR
jgi:glycosyltransferase involved in cell wall biosynthesis